MEFPGNEKKIQALFSELRLADGLAAPHFGVVWNCAQSKTFRSRRALNPSFVGVMAVVLCALALLLWWSRDPRLGRQSVAVSPKAPVDSGAGAAQTAKNEARIKVSRAGQRNDASTKSRAMKLSARRHEELLASSKKGMRDAIAISNWQSPTVALMRSSSDEVLTSLPDLSQSANELKSFLPGRLN